MVQNNIIILEEKENPLFKRKEIKTEFNSEITPSKTKMVEMLAEKLKVSQENIIIKKIAGKFGSKNFVILADVYYSKEDKPEKKSKEKKNV